MIEARTAIAIHNVILQQFGGRSGVRNEEHLHSALLRPYHAIEGNLLFNTPPKKAAALLESLIINHPFLDGNLRTAYVLFRYQLLKEGLDIIAPTEEKLHLISRVASGQMTFEKILQWTQGRILTL